MCQIVYAQYGTTYAASEPSRNCGPRPAGSSGCGEREAARARQAAARRGVVKIKLW